MNKRSDKRTGLADLRNRQVALRLYYTVIVFYILFVTMALVGGFCLLLVSAGVVVNLNYLPIIIVCLVSILVGTLLSAYISRRI
ncbi:MAG: hypothetical protein J6T26_10250, partial [Firmicutes bacterium]|nr:hypothetical protein [Bacillota bacterium]